MSYCVNCGVELATEAKKCPLCGCCVINPMEKDKPIEEISEKAWPDEKDNFNFLTQRRFYSFVFTIILCVPMLVCTLANLAYSNTLSWSLYIIGGVITVWIIAVPPILWRHIKTSSFILTDILAALVFTGVIEFITMPGTWFIKMVLPVGTFGLLFSYILSLLIENGKIKGLYVSAYIFLLLGIFIVIIEIFCDLYLTGTFSVQWSLFAFIPCEAAAVILAAIEKNQKAKAAIEKRFHL